MMVLTYKPKVDAALLVEELVEIYSTPTTKDWCEAKKVIILIDWLCDIDYNSQGLYLYPEA